MMKYAIACALVFVLFTTARAEDTEYQLPPETTAYTESTSTDHLVGDTVARGLNLVLNPIYRGTSHLYFWACKPPTVQHVTIVRLEQPEPAQTQPEP
ncbi:MAG: hypothetical protein Kow0099_19250 [Candidatus Abyssubacteria bacterium]